MSHIIRNHALCFGYLLKRRCLIACFKADELSLERNAEEVNMVLLIIKIKKKISTKNKCEVFEEENVQLTILN